MKKYNEILKESADMIFEAGFRLGGLHVHFGNHSQQQVKPGKDVSLGNKFFDKKSMSLNTGTVKHAVVRGGEHFPKSITLHRHDGQTHHLKYTFSNHAKDDIQKLKDAGVEIHYED